MSANTFIALGVGYLLGSVPFAYLLARRHRGIDLRMAGSGNVGAANLLRNTTKKIGISAMALDVGKGIASVLVARQIDPGTTGPAVAGIAAVLGHIYPVWLGFQGGKGVATYIGVLIGMHWPAALWFGIIWAGVALGSRYSSLAALSAVVGVVLYYVVTGWAGLPFVVMMSALVFLKHHANIRRLLEGRENKIGARS